MNEDGQPVQPLLVWSVHEVGAQVIWQNGLLFTKETNNTKVINKDKFARGMKNAFFLLFYFINFILIII